LTHLSFLFCLKLIFITLFILLNIFLLYIEFLDRKYNTNTTNTHLESGIPELRKVLKDMIVILSITSSVITVNNERIRRVEAAEAAKKQEEKQKELNDKLEKTEKELAEATNEKTANAFFHRANISIIQDSKKTI